MAELTIVVDRSPDPKDTKVLIRGLDRHALAQVNTTPPEPVSVYVYDDGGKIVGGVAARIWDGVLDISILWVHEEYRGEGYGRQLMAAVEAEGFARGCVLAELRTFNYQAPEFYKKIGYEEYLVVEGWPRGHRRHFFRKRLASPAP
jgi:ribosomal protein S18 acetylase RimI-like enzyme